MASLGILPTPTAAVQPQHFRARLVGLIFTAVSGGVIKLDFVQTFDTGKGLARIPVFRAWV